MRVDGPRLRVDALRILAARHLQSVLRAGELHPLHRARRDDLEHDAASADEIRRTGQHLKRRDAAGEVARELRILRPHRVLGPHVRRHRVRWLRCRRRLRVAAGRRVDAEVRVVVDDAGRDVLAAFRRSRSRPRARSRSCPTAAILPSRSRTLPLRMRGPAAVRIVTLRMTVVRDGEGPVGAREGIGVRRRERPGTGCRATRVCVALPAGASGPCGCVEGAAGRSASFESALPPPAIATAR